MPAAYRSTVAGRLLRTPRPAMPVRPASERVRARLRWAPPAPYLEISGHAGAVEQSSRFDHRAVRATETREAIALTIQTVNENIDAVSLEHSEAGVPDTDTSHPLQ